MMLFKSSNKSDPVYSSSNLAIPAKSAGIIPATNLSNTGSITASSNCKSKILSTISKTFNTFSVFKMSEFSRIVSNLSITLALTLAIVEIFKSVKIVSINSKTSLPTAISSCQLIDSITVGSTSIPTLSKTPLIISAPRPSNMFMLSKISIIDPSFSANCSTLISASNSNNVFGSETIASRFSIITSKPSPKMSIKA